jgi:hypothetical protein
MSVEDSEQHIASCRSAPKMPSPRRVLPLPKKALFEHPFLRKGMLLRSFENQPICTCNLLEKTEEKKLVQRIQQCINYDHTTTRMIQAVSIWSQTALPRNFSSGMR